MAEKETRISTVNTRTSAQNPYLFVVGSPRSGTTLLKRMLDAHRSIAITRETHWIPRYFKSRKGLTPDGMVTTQLIPALFEYHRFPHLKLDSDDLRELLDTDAPLSYQDFVSGIFNLYGQGKGKPLVGDKTPGYVRAIPVLHHLWPAARFVHIIRDGRDVCLSMMNWRMSHRGPGRFRTYEEDRVSTTALWWEWHVRLGREAARTLEPSLYYEIRYEELTSRPERELESLCGFLGVVPDRAMLKFHEGRTRQESDLSTNRSWLPPTPGIRDWKSQMTSENLELFEAVAGGLLQELGYKRAVPEPSPPALNHAARMRSSFIEDIHERGGEFPEAWQP